MKKIKKTDEFRKLNNKESKGHPTYIYAQYGNQLKYIGITHAEITKGTRNIKLDKNPDPNDTKTSFLRSSPAEEKKKKFGKVLFGWRFGDSDRDKVKEVIEKDSGKGKEGKKKKGRRTET